MKKLPVGYSNKNFFEYKFYQLKILTGKNFDIFLAAETKIDLRFLNYQFQIGGFSMQKQPPEMFCKKGVLRNFTKFTGNHLS